MLWSEVTHLFKHHVALELAGNHSQCSLGGQEGELEAALLTYLKHGALCSDQSPLSAQPELPNNGTEPKLRQNKSRGMISKT